MLFNEIFVIYEYALNVIILTEWTISICNDQIIISIVIHMLAQYSLSIAWITIHLAPSSYKITILVTLRLALLIKIVLFKRLPKLTH